MKKLTLLTVCLCLLLCLLAGCGENGVTTTTEDPSSAAEKVDDATLTQLKALFADADSGYSRAARCLFPSADQISLGRLFYSGYTAEKDSLTAEEQNFLKEKFSAEDLEAYDLSRLPAGEVKAFWETYFTVSFPAEPDLSPWVYGSDWDSYYHLHSDSNIIQVEVLYACVLEDQAVDVYYCDALTQTDAAQYVMRLQPKADGGYYILSNCEIEQ